MLVDGLHNHCPRVSLEKFCFGDIMRRFCIALTCLVLLRPIAATAQQGPLPLQNRPSLLLQLRWLRFMVLDGRLAVAAVSDTQTASRLGTEHCTISLTPNGAVLDYDLTSPDESLVVHIEGDDRAAIRRQFTQPADPKSPGGGSSSPAQIIVEYTQSPQQPVKLAVTANGETRTIEADSLWHLLMFQSELSGRYLVPILELLRPDWQLMSTAGELKQTLLQVARAGQAANWIRWAALVAQLADEHYAVRQHAERQLRAAGRAALPYLQSLQRSELDAEQWRRVSEIIDASTDYHEDSPQRIATRLMDDRTVWLEFLADSQESTRRTAADRLAALVGAKIDFDPAASPAARDKQIAAVRARLIPKK